MSLPPNTSSIVLLDPHHHHPLLLSTTTSATTSAAAAAPAKRDYRKGNWTLDETLILISAKRSDDERRAESKLSCKTTELRWKWVENYCWKQRCFRSQNQCNDKWDNLLRDYKKVRDYEAGAGAGEAPSSDRPSYWQMEKHERKERNLPSNLLFEVFQALHDVVNRRYTQRSSPPDAPTPAPVISPPPPLPPPPHPPPEPPLQSPVSVEMTDSSETEGSERVDTETKRRKVGKVGSSVVRSASLLAQTLLACEEKKEKRHQDVLELEERRLQIAENRNEIAENRNEMNRQGIDGLVTAVNNLSSAIHALVSNRHNTR